MTTPPDFVFSYSIFNGLGLMVDALMAGHGFFLGLVHQSQFMVSDSDLRSPFLDFHGFSILCMFFGMFFGMFTGW